MTPFFSFLRRRKRNSDVSATGVESASEPPILSVPGTLQSQASSELINVLRGFLPPPGASIPAPDVSLVSLQQKPVGIGNRRGVEVRNPFNVVELKGVRLDAVVRFTLWASSPTTAETAATELNNRLTAQSDILWNSGFMRLALESAPLPDFVSDINAWRKHGDYQVLYEYRYRDSDGAESLIASIPIRSDLEGPGSLVSETTLVTDETVRWDNEAAPSLSLRGRLVIGGLSALAFVPTAAPTGTVILTRTFDGATGPPTSFATLTAFLAAVAGPGATERHGKITFNSLSDFLAAFTAAGDPIALGDWNADGLPDNYKPLALAFEPTVQLPGTGDRLEITYGDPAFNQIAVVYLKATGG